MDVDARIRHQRVKANGLDFHVASCGEGDRLALLLHGFPECWYSWRYQMPLLADLGYRVWAPDLRGYGSSDRPHGIGAYSIEKLMEDAAGLIDASGARSTLLMAHDWGAMIAWYFAIRRVRPLERLVIMNVPHPAAGRMSLRQLRRSWYVLFFQLPQLPEAMIRARDYRMIEQAFRGMAVDASAFPDEVIDVYKRSASHIGAPTAMVNYYRALVRGGGALRQRRLGHPKIETPTLMIWGEHDSALGVENTYDTGEHVSNFQVRYLPVSHWVQQEAPGPVNEMLEAWLRDKEVPGATQPGTR